MRSQSALVREHRPTWARRCDRLPSDGQRLLPDFYERRGALMYRSNTRTESPLALSRRRFRTSRGSFVGVTGMPQPDGSQKAVEVHNFPEAMRGTGEGHRPWDLGSQSPMNNANVAQIVAGIDGQTLTLKYKDGEKKIITAPDTPIVSYMPGDKNDLKPGVKIFIAAAQKQPDGSLRAPRVNFGKDGLTPPM